MEFALAATSLSFGLVHAGCCAVQEAQPAPSMRRRGIDPVLLGSMVLMLIGMADTMLAGSQLLPGIAWVGVFLALAGLVALLRGRAHPAGALAALHLLVMAALTAAMLGFPQEGMDNVAASGHVHGGTGGLAMLAWVMTAGYVIVTARAAVQSGPGLRRAELGTALASVGAMAAMLLL